MTHIHHVESTVIRVAGGREQASRLLLLSAAAVSFVLSVSLWFAGSEFWRSAQARVDRFRSSLRRTADRLCRRRVQPSSDQPDRRLRQADKRRAA